MYCHRAWVFKDHDFQPLTDGSCFANTAAGIKVMKTKLLGLILLTASSLLGARVFVGVGVGLGGYGYPAAYPPPPPVPVAAYYAPVIRPGYARVGGYYAPIGPRYVARPGYYVRPPFVGAYWVGPRYIGGRYFGGYWRR